MNTVAKVDQVSFMIPNSRGATRKGFAEVDSGGQGGRGELEEEQGNENWPAFKARMDL